MSPRALPILFAALAIVACSPSASVGQAMMSMVAPPPEVTVLARPAEWTSYELFDESRIFMSGRINGRDAPVMLDSGAAMTTVDSAFAAQLHLEPGFNVPVSGAVGGVGGQLMKGVTLEVAGVRLENMTVLVIDLSSVSRQIGHPMPVILGREVFETLVADLDLPNRRLAFRSRDGWRPPAEARRLPLTTSGDGQRSFPISIEGSAPVQAHFDLGNGGALFLRPAYWQGRDLLKDHRSSMTVTGGVGGMKPAPILSLREVSLGGATVREVPTVLAPSAGRDPADANVGFAVLSRFHLYADYAGDSLYLVPDAPSLAKPFRRNRAGLSTTPVRSEEHTSELQSH